MKYFIFSILILILFSCGPSKEEIALKEKYKQDSINLVEKNKQEIKEQVAEALKVEKKKKIVERENYTNNANNFLETRTEWEQRLFKEKRLSVKFLNKDKNRKILNVKFEVRCYSLTDVYLGSYNDAIYDYIKPNEWFTRNIGVGNFPAQSNKYSIKIISSEFYK